MPLYRIKGLDPDNTYLFDAPPVEDKYELVVDKPAKPAEIVVPDDVKES